MTVSADDGAALTKLNELRRKSFREQAIWFLNTSSVGQDKEKCECVRRIEQKCLDIEKGIGSESVLDEFTAHRLLEYSNTPCTVPEFRNFVEGIHGNKKRRVSLAELLIYAFDDDWITLLNSPDCYDIIAEKRAREELQKLKTELSKLTDAAKDGARAAEEAHQSEIRALETESKAAEARDAAKKAEQLSHDLLEKESESLKALSIQQESTSQKRADLEAIVADSSKGIVARSKANAELAILLSEDPLQLRTARIRQESAIRKSAEAFAKHKEAVEQAEVALQLAMVARAEAIKRKDAAMEASRAAEDSIPAAQKAFERASKILDEITKKQESGQGTVFFLNADLNESRRFLPKSKFVVAQKNTEEAMRKSISSL